MEGDVMDNKGQGALEYLLLIGGAVLIAAIVIVVLNSLAGSGSNSANLGSKYSQNSLDNIEGILTP